jgi:hypothetical protein
MEAAVRVFYTCVCKPVVVMSTYSMHGLDISHFPLPLSRSRPRPSTYAADAASSSSSSLSLPSPFSPSTARLATTAPAAPLSLSSACW